MWSLLFFTINERTSEAISKPVTSEIHSKFRIVVVVYLLKNDSSRSSGMLDKEYHFGCYKNSTANELFAIRLRRVTAGAKVFHEEAHDHPRKSSARNGNRQNPCF